MKADSGASKYFVKEDEKMILSSIQEDTSTVVILPNKMELNTSTVGTLPLSPALTPKAVKANVLPGMTNSSLLSIGQLCDNDCIALFHKKYLHIYKSAQLVLKGDRNKIDGLWDVSIKIKQYKRINAIIRKD